MQNLSHVTSWLKYIVHYVFVSSIVPSSEMYMKSS